jgi:hypothetical protein
MGGTMGDRSPKAKQRDKKRKSTAKATDVARARSKQEAYASKIPGQKGPG